MTQVQLAHAAGTSQPTLAAYESGAKSPSVRTLNKIVRAAGASIRVELIDTPAAQGALLTFVRAHQAEIRDAARRRGIRNVRVFGSAARGQETTDSDVDFLVDFDAERRGLAPLAGFIAEARSILRRDVDATTPGLLRDAVRTNALAEAAPL